MNTEQENRKKPESFFMRLIRLLRKAAEEKKDATRPQTEKTAYAELLKLLRNDEEKNIMRSRARDVSRKTRTADLETQESVRSELSEEVQSEKEHAQATRENTRDLLSQAEQVADEYGGTPDWLETSGIGQSIPAMELVARIAALPPDLRDDPYVLHQEAMRAYLSTDWQSLTQTEFQETKRVFDSVLNRAAGRIAELEGANEKDITQELWDSFDSRPDIYRTHKLEEPKQDDLSEPEYQDAVVKRQSLEELLQYHQGLLDAYDPQNFPAQIRELETLRSQLDRGVSEGRLRREDAEEYVRRIETYRSKLAAAEKKSKAKEGVFQERMKEENRRKDEQLARDAKVEGTPEFRRQQILDALEIDELKQVAQQIFALESGPVDEVQIRRLRSELGNILLDPDVSREGLFRSEAFKQYEDKLKEEYKHVPNAQTEDIEARKSEQVRLAKELDAILRRQFLRLEARPDSDRHWHGEKGERDYQRMNASITKRLEHAIDHPDEDPDAFRDLDEIFFDILSIVDQSPNQSFRESFNLYREADLETFYVNLRTLMQREGVSDDAVNRILQRYTSLRNLKESFHNFFFISHSANIEQLAKYSATFLSEDADFMFANVRGVELAFKTQELALQRIRSDYGGYLPTHILGKDPKMRAKWQEMYTGLFDRAIKMDGNLSGMHEWEKKIAHQFALGFGIVSMRHLEEIAKAFPAADFASIYMEGLARDTDPFRHLITKFGVGKPGLAILYTIFTGDHETGLKMRGWGKEEIIAAFHEKMSDEQLGKQLVNLQNLMNISSRFGPDSMWGVNRGAEDWSQELWDQRGFSLRIAAAKGADEVREILGEALDKTPLAIARHWANDTSSEWRVRRLDVLQEVLGTDAVGLNFDLTYEVDKDIKKKITVTSFSDLLLLNPANEAAYNDANNKHKIKIRGQHLSSQEKQRLDSAWESLMKQVDILEGDLDLVQQIAIFRLQEQAARGESAAPDQRGISEADYRMLDEILREEGVGDEERRRRRGNVQEYAKKIKQAATEKPYSATTKRTYIEELAYRFNNGLERRLISTLDVPYSRFHYARWGGRGFVRRLIDTQAQVEASQGIGNYLYSLKGHVDKERMVEQMYKEIYLKLAQYDDRVAKKVCFLLANGTLKFYGEQPEATYSGILGDIMGFVSDTSLSKSFYGRRAEAWGADDKYHFIHDLEEMGMLAFEGEFEKWNIGHGWSAHDLAKLNRAGVRYIALEYLSYAIPLGILLVLYKALSSASEEAQKESSGGHH